MPYPTDTKEEQMIDHLGEMEDRGDDSAKDEGFAKDYLESQE